MSRLHLHRWAVIFLLVSKLILGELTHAMPHEAAAINEVATSVHASDDNPACGSHVQAASESGQSQDASTDHPTKNCCKGGECACPCLHSPAAAAAISYVMQLTHDDQAAVLVQGATWHRSSGLFRPPA